MDKIKLVLVFEIEYVQPLLAAPKMGHNVLFTLFGVYSFGVC